MQISDFTSEPEVSMKWRTNPIATAVITAHNYEIIVPSITSINVREKVSSVN